jgi:hypothetical protein
MDVATQPFVPLPGFGAPEPRLEATKSGVVRLSFCGDYALSRVDSQDTNLAGDGKDLFDVEGASPAVTSHQRRC